MKLLQRSCPEPKDAATLLAEWMVEHRVQPDDMGQHEGCDGHWIVAEADSAGRRLLRCNGCGSLRR